MLKSWSIKNFKPIVDSGELQLAPVTVLAGRNSSGKSSLLQSILMIAQTLGSRLLDRPLLPNERIVQLGTYDDILSEISNSRILELVVELEMGDEEVQTPSRLRRSSMWNVKSAKFLVLFNSAMSDAKISSAIEAPQITVEHMHLKADTELIVGMSQIHPELKRFAKISFNMKKAGDNDIQHFLENVASDERRLIVSSDKNNTYLGHFEKIHESFLQEGVAEEYLVTLSHFLPSVFTMKYNISKRRKRDIAFYIHRYLREASSLPPGLRSAKFFDPEAPFSPKLIDSINALCQKSNIKANFSDLSLIELASWVRSKIPPGRRKSAFFDELENLVLQEYLDKYQVNEQENFEGLESKVNNIYIDSLEQVIEQITSFFTSKIRYLGPLRADPQASQKFGPSSELDDVGAKGEFAAAVYEANQDARIEWYNPQNKQVERGKLRDALDCWTQYLSVAQQIKTEIAGLSGVAWKVIPKTGRQARSLPEVGVGISQILPILVMGLLSPTNTLLIIEQPELHLHPFVQARLGDFFMGLAKCKKQCLIETHSENLVSQLRLHIVQAGGLEKSDCMVYFVDQDERGAAKFEKIEISPNGNIQNWPDGFFDETMLQEDRITAASLRKRVEEAKHGS